MYRFAVHRLAALSILTGLGAFSTSCTFEDGIPWARADGSLTASFEVPQDRLTDDGTIRTANDYLVSLDSLVLEIGRVEILQSAAAAEVDFDPGNPPEGYSLCHNGHCHANSGELVDYNEIIADLNDRAGGGIRTLVMSGPSGDLWSEPFMTEFEDCPPKGCPLGQAPITGLQAEITNMQLGVAVVDDRKGEYQRVEPFETDIAFDFTASLRANLREAVGYHGENQLRFDAQLSVSAQSFDSIDWATLAEPIPEASRNQLAMQIASALEENAILSVNVHRYDL